MAFNTSSVFRQLVADLFNNTQDMDWDTATTVKAALFPDTITPDNDVSAADSAYDAGVWLSTSEISDGTNWDAGGEPVTSRTISVATADKVILDAVDTPQGGASTTLTDVAGCLVYNDSATSPADQGFCFNDFGGLQSVSAGNFTIIWNTGGVMEFTATAA